MQREFGWSRGALAIGPIVGLVYSLLNPLGGMATDRYGARPVAIAGLIFLSIAILALAATPISPISFYGILVVLGVLGTVTNNVVYCKAVATWFTRNAGSAIALVLSGVSVFGAAMQPLLAFVIVRRGWRMGYVCLAGITLIIGLPLVLKWFRERDLYVHARASSISALPGASMAQAFRDKRYWLIVGAFGGAALPIGGFVSQLQPLLINKGYPVASAAIFVSVFLLATAVGRVAAGFLFDRYPPPFVAGAFLALSGIGALTLGLTDLSAVPRLAPAGAISLIGLAQGAEGDFIALFTLRTFGLRHFSALFATIATASGIAFAIGGFMFAAVFDRRGDYTLAVLTSALILLFTALLAMTIKVPPHTTAAELA